MGFVLEEITGEELEIVTKTDRVTLECALKSGNGVKSRRLRIDVAAIQEMIELKGVNIEWVQGSDQLADALTISSVNPFKLREGVSGGKEREMVRWK